jgi:hypothetical protein
MSEEKLADQFQRIKDAVGCDDHTAAILVLADSISGVAKAVVRVFGDPPPDAVEQT